MTKLLRCWLVGMLLLGTIGCVNRLHYPAYQQLQEQVDACQDLRNLADASDVDLASVFAVNRFWASFTQEKLTPAEREFWWQQIQQQWRERFSRLVSTLSVSKPIASIFDICLQQIDQTAQPSIEVPANYSTTQRVLGLYPLTRYGVALGSQQWRDDTTELLQSGQEALNEPVVNYVASDRLAIIDTIATQQLLADSQQNPLNIPLLTPSQAQEQAQQLLLRYAPDWRVETAGDYDRIGALYSQDGLPSVDVSRPTLYTAIGHTRFAGQSLLQLYYVIWFSERPPNGWFDILAGNIDSVIWRVTLQADGEVLLYDSIHSCGCYHLLFPSSKLSIKRPNQKPSSQKSPSQTGDFVEAPLIYPLEDIYRQRTVQQPSEKVTVVLQSGTHYIVDLVPSDYLAIESAAALNMQPYHQLAPLFDAAGLLPSTERAERWLLWPTGVISPGQMRQLGTQATAFIGERHFDDAFIFETLFEPNDFE